MKRNPVLIIMSVLTALEVVIGTPLLADLVGVRNAALVAVVFAAVQAGVAAWIRTSVTPVADPKDNQGKTLVPTNGNQ